MAEAMLKRSFTDAANGLSGSTNEYQNEHYAHIKVTELEEGKEPRRNRISLASPLLNKAVDILKAKRMLDGVHLLAQRGSYKITLMVKDGSLMLASKKDGFNTPYATVTATDIASFKTFLEALKTSIHFMSSQNGSIESDKKAKKRSAKPRTKTHAKKQTSAASEAHLLDQAQVVIIESNGEETDEQQPGTSGTQAEAQA